MKFKLLPVLALSLGLLFFAAQSSPALSTTAQIKTNDAQSFSSFIKIKAYAADGGGRRFRIIVTPYTSTKHENVFGILDVYQDDKPVVRCNVAGVRLAMKDQDVDAAVKDESLVFEFTVAPDHLMDSKFCVNLSSPEESRFDEYWFYLDDFADAK